jgi:hypothetical protein
MFRRERASEALFELLLLGEKWQEQLYLATLRPWAKQARGSAVILLGLSSPIVKPLK